MLLFVFLTFPPLAFSEHGLTGTRYQMETDGGLVHILDAHTGAIGTCLNIESHPHRPYVVCSKWVRPAGEWSIEPEPESTPALTEQEMEERREENREAVRQRRRED